MLIVVVPDDVLVVKLATTEVGAGVDMADRFTATEVIVFEAEPEDMTVRVVVSQLVIATWHCCAEVVLRKV